MTQTVTAAFGSGETLLDGPVGLPEIITYNPKLDGKLVVMANTPVGAVEQYRKLAATLHHAQVEQDIRVIMVTSAVPSEGKTLTAANLALTLSESYRRQVLLIDADLRRPAMFDVFQVSSVMGLSDWLKTRKERKLTPIRISEHLAYIPAGHPDPDPMSGLTSDRMGRLVKDAATMFDWVIIDTPPVGLLSDANLLTRNVDGALLVIRAGVTPYELIQRAVHALGRDRLMGVVMNQIDDKRAGRRYGYGGYHGYYSQPVDGGKTVR